MNIPLLDMKQLILTAIAMLLVTTAFSQEVRTYNGTNNNLQNPDWGAAHTQQARLLPPAYADQISAPAGAQRQNPRRISNALFRQDASINDHMGLSDFVWVFGQFIDHDITLTENNTREPVMIPVNFADPQFNPGGAIPDAVIPMFRNEHMEGTGTSTDNPREHGNAITAWLDASAVYGSDKYHADWLRSFEEGKLKVSAGNLLPYNTIDGEFDSPIDPDAPFLEDAVGLAPRLFVAGDIRVNENILLTAYHTLFVREHNRICDELIEQHPDWQDEQIYQHARRIVSGLLQQVTFNEWLPAMGVHLPEYQGYQPDVNPAIFNVFSAAAFRMGHTLLSGQIMVIDENGNERPEGPLLLREAFFNPSALTDNGGLEPFFRGMASQVQQNMDAKVVDDVRNFLFGPPGSGGMDLVAININRGRERGLPDFNSFRVAMGLEPYESFRQITTDQEAIEALQSNYINVDDIDPWVGFLAESNMDNTIFGPTVMAILKRQFSAIRDGDRFYFEIDPGLSEEEKEVIRNTKMSDIVMRNTGIDLMQKNVFEAKPMREICGFYGTSASVRGVVTNEFGTTILNVDVSLNDGEDQPLRQVIANGSFRINDVKTCEDMVLRLNKKDNHSNGISTLDMVLILKHILGMENLQTPYRMIAADVNRSGTISTADLVAIRKIILGTATEFPNNTSWRFIDADYNFLDDNPLDEEFPEYINFTLSRDADFNFIALKVGDVNGTANHTSASNSLIAAQGRSAQPILISTTDMPVVAGQTYSIPFEFEGEHSLTGYQFTMNYNNNALEFVAPAKGQLLQEEHLAVNERQIRASWFDVAAAPAEDLTFALEFKALENGQLSDFITMVSNPTVAEAYNQSLETMDIQLQFQSVETAELVLLQNTPNPFSASTTIAFELPQASPVTLSVFDMAGKKIYEVKDNLNAGFQQLEINAADLQQKGLLYYQLNTNHGTATRKMMALNR